MAADAQDIADDLEADTADENKPEIKQSSWPSADQWQRIIQNAWQSGIGVLGHSNYIPPAQPPGGNVIGQAIGGNSVQPVHLPPREVAEQGFQGGVGNNYTNAPIRPLPVTPAEMPTSGDPLTPVAKSLHNQTFGDLLDRFGYGDKKSWLSGLDTKLDAGKPIEPQLQAFMAQQSPVVRSQAGDIVGPIRDKLTQQYPALKGGDPFTRLNTALVAPPAGPGQPGPNAAQYGAYINPQMQIQPNVLRAPQQIAGGIDRSNLADEARQDATALRLAAMVKGEVLGNASVRAQQAQLETAFNRAQARGISLDSALRDTAHPAPDQGGYYPSKTFARGYAFYRNNPQELENFKANVLEPVLAGKNTFGEMGLPPMTGNASDEPGNAVRSHQIRNGTQYTDQLRKEGGDSYFNEGPFKGSFTYLPETQSTTGKPTQPLPPEAFSSKPLSQTPVPLRGGSPDVAPQGPFAPRPPSNPAPPNTVEGQPIAKTEPEKKAPDDKFEKMAALLRNTPLDEPNLLLRAKLAEAMHPQNFLTPPARGLDLAKALAKIRLPKGFRPNPVG